MLSSLPPPRWVCLRSQTGQLLAKFDAQRGLLEIVLRGEPHCFDLLTLTQQATPAAPREELVLLEIAKPLPLPEKMIP